MRIRLSLTIDLDRARPEPVELREVDIPGTATERLPEEPYYEDKKVGFRVN
jgi:hypothetical protein